MRISSKFYHEKAFGRDETLIYLSQMFPCFLLSPLLPEVHVYALDRLPTIESLVPPYPFLTSTSDNTNQSIVMRVKECNV
jgi:hypothetical protein